MKQESNDLSFLLGLISGALVGSALAALFVPRSGPQTREQIVERGLELKNQAEDVIDRAQKVATQTVAKVQESAQELLKTSSTLPNTAETE
jgi:gas vesicle protein